jgi:hypothetical protein
VGERGGKKRNETFYLVLLLVKLIDVNFPLILTMAKFKDCIVEVSNPKTKTIGGFCFPCY